MKIDDKWKKIEDDEYDDFFIEDELEEKIEDYLIYNKGISIYSWKNFFVNFYIDEEITEKERKKIVNSFQKMAEDSKNNFILDYFCYNLDDVNNKKFLNNVIENFKYDKEEAIKKFIKHYFKLKYHKIFGFYSTEKSLIIKIITYFYFERIINVVEEIKEKFNIEKEYKYNFSRLYEILSFILNNDIAFFIVLIFVPYIILEMKMIFIYELIICILDFYFLKQNQKFGYYRIGEGIPFFNYMLLIGLPIYNFFTKNLIWNPINFLKCGAENFVLIVYFIIKKHFIYSKIKKITEIILSEIIVSETNYKNNKESEKKWN